MLLFQSIHICFILCGVIFLGFYMVKLVNLNIISLPIYIIPGGIVLFSRDILGACITSFFNLWQSIIHSFFVDVCYKHLFWPGYILERKFTLPHLVFSECPFCLVYMTFATLSYSPHTVKVISYHPATPSQPYQCILRPKSHIAPRSSRPHCMRHKIGRAWGKLETRKFISSSVCILQAHVSMYRHFDIHSPKHIGPYIYFFFLNIRWIFLFFLVCKYFSKTIQFIAFFRILQL